MVEPWSESEAFGELRSLLNLPVTAKLFERVVDHIEKAEAHEPGLYDARWRGDVEGATRGWPPEIRVTSVWGREEAAEAAAAPWRGLFKGVTLRGFDLGLKLDAEWIANELRAKFEDLEHLGFLEMYVRKAQVARACRVGVFDGVQSLSFQDCSFRPVTFDVLMSHLESGGGVRRLAFRQCSFGVAQVERLCESPLMRRVESLDLSWNQSIKAAGCMAISNSAGTFDALEELSLGGTDPGVRGALWLSSAPWAPALKPLELRGAAISSAGLEAFIDAGRLGLLMRRGRNTVLDLWGFSLRDRALTALAGCEELAQVDALWLHGNALTTVAPLLGSPHLGRLESLDVSGNELGEDAVGALITLIEETSPRALSVDDMRLGDAFVERLCASESSRALTALAMKGAGYRERGLAALLDWPHLSDVRVLHAEFQVVAGSSLAERALETGRFVEGAYVSEEGRVAIGSYRGYVFEA